MEEKIFAHAVALTAAFVANGDIRCGGSTREDSSAMAQVGDMVTILYSVLERVQADLAMSGVK